MKKQLFIGLSLVMILVVSSCKKKEDPAPTPSPTPTSSTELFIKFSLDGAAKSFTGTEQSMHTGFGGGSFTSSGFFNFTDNIDISLSMPLDSIMGSDLQSLVGTKIPIGSCGGCPTNIQLDYEINGNEYRSSDTYNALPAEYIKFNTVTFQKNVTSFGKSLNQYYVTGEFNVKLNYGTDVKNASNGTFGLLFRESKN